jgi:rhodanese-related sulfurtransferase/DNA-binding transcriptional ArsR family regulator
MASFKYTFDYLFMPATTRPASLKAAVFAQIARIGQAASSPIRLELLDLLSQGPRTVEALAQQTGQSAATTSHHLQVLRRARLVEAEKAGLYVTYRLADPLVEAFLLDLRRLAETRLAEIEQITRQFLDVRSALEPVDNDELLRRVRSGDVTLIVVRPGEEYMAGHIPGAISMPLPDLPKRLKELQKRRDIVAYCRGPYCVMALDAVDLLRRNGFRAHRLEHGVAEWRARGWRVESGDARHAGGRP